MNMVFARPVGRDAIHGVGGSRQSFVPILSYGAAAVVGSATAGLVAGLAGALLLWIGGPLWVGAVAILAIVGLAAITSELRYRVCLFPQRQAQVPKRWLSWGQPTKTAAAFGFMLGGGVFTYLHHASSYALGILLILAPSPATAVLAAIPYGLTRAFVLAWAWYSGVGADGGMRLQSLRRLDRLGRLLPYAALPCFLISVFQIM